MTQKSLCATAALAVSGLPRPRNWLNDPSITYLRLRGLGSMAMALDPSLGPGIRFIQRAPIDAEERRAIPYDIVFTKDVRTKLPHGVIEDESPVPFWEGVERVLGPEATVAERALIDVMPRQRFASPEDAALYSAYKDGHLNIHHRQVNDEQVVATSDAILPRADEFMLHADLARVVYLTPVPENAPGGRGPGYASLYHTRQLVQRVREVLRQPFEAVSSAERLGVVRAISALNGPRAERGAEPTFEERQSHGWASYALANGQGEWVAFLLAKGATSPHVPYGQHRPLELAIALDHPGAVAALSKAGVSPNVALRGWPEVYDARSQRVLATLDDLFVPPLAFAAAVGATSAAGGLLRAGADPNQGTERGHTPLSLSASSGDEATVRLLLRHGANPTQADAMGVLPAEKIPALPDFDSLFSLMETAAANYRSSASVPVPPTSPVSSGGISVEEASPIEVVPTENPIPSMWEEPTRRRGARMR